jgi:steroid delta-isomerase-like uncharacterized protein
MDPRAIEKVIVEHVDAENVRDMPRVLATYGKDAVFEDVPGGKRFAGKDAIASNYAETFRAFPDLDRRITRMTTSDNACVAELTLTGSQTGVFRGLAPTGRRGSVKIICHFEMDEDGLIRQETAHYDSAALLVQLGLIPDLSTAGGRLWLLIHRPSLLWRRLRARLAGG